jgi:plastocyanin
MSARVVVAVVSAVGALAGPMTASASMEGDTPPIPASIMFAAFAPERLDIVAGDTVQWTNDSVRAHDVTADDDSYDSMRMAPGDMFSQRFDAAGAFTYHCRLHPFMRGEIDAYVLLLDKPAATAAPGRSFPLSGRAALPAGSKVTIEADSGGGFQPVTTATIGHGGQFVASVTPTTTARYRAVAGDQVSPDVELVVLDHSVLVTPARRRAGYSVLANVLPAAPGAPVVLQLRLRDRFGWWPVARARLGRDSRVRLFTRLRRRVPARVVMTLADGATPLAISRTFALGPRRRG